MANELALALKPLVPAFSSPLIVRVLDSFKRDKTLKRELEVQIENLKIFISTVEAYRNAFILNNEDISRRYAILKDIIQTGVDALELYSEAIETDKIHTLQNKVKNFGYSFMIHACNPHCSNAFLRTIERANNDIAKLLENVNIKDELPMLNSLPENQQKLRPIATSAAESKMLGRDKIKDEIVRTLNNEYNGAASETLSVFAIVGMGGIGKTRLAQSVHETVTCGFDLKGWVDDNSKKFDVATLLENILKQFNGGVSPNNSTLNELVNSLQETVRNKKFLLIIDDVWTTDPSCWEDLLKSLKTGKPGSWLIITTRDKAVVQSIDRCKKETVKELSGLNMDTLWDIVKQHAFDEFDPKSHGNLEIIGRRIVRRLDGSPLAAKAIGRVLKSNTSERQWKLIEESELWKSLKDTNLVPALVLSFLHLPSRAKPCFTYCSLFPKKDYITTNREMMYQWLCHDFIGLDDEKASVEDVGATVIDEMKNMHLCAEWKGKITQFRMHDLIHDMSRASGKDDYLQILDVESIEKMLEGKSHLRHLYIELIPEKFNMESLSELQKCEKLRTLIIRGSWMRKDSCPSAWLKNLPCLRVLTLWQVQLEKVPEEIGKLKYLRYLDLSYNTIEQLPRFLAELYHLQVLILHGCEIRASESIDFQRLTRLLYLDLSGNDFLTTLPNSMSVLSNLQVLFLDDCFELQQIPDWISELRNLECLSVSGTAITILPEGLASLSCLRELHLKTAINLEALPSNFTKLANLRHLHLNKDSERLLLSSVSGIGKLTSLESLNTFAVQYHKIDELANLNMLHGKLVIKGLHRVQSKDEAQNAKLQQKIHLNELAYYYGDDAFIYSENRDVLNEEDVLECLKPCKQLTNFTLNGYLGCKLPSWLTTPNFQFLKCLILQNSKIHKVEIWDFPVLEELVFQNLCELTEWIGADMMLSRFLSRLRKVEIVRCEKLKKLPDLPLSLEVMSLEDVGLGELPSLQCQRKMGDGEAASSSSSQQSSLSHLSIWQCPSLLSLNEGLLSSPRLLCLRRLLIRSCDNLQHPPVNGFQHFESLEILEIRKCSKLTKLSCTSRSNVPVLPSGIKELRLDRFCLHLPTLSTNVFLEVHTLTSCTCNTWLDMITDNKEVSFIWKCTDIHISVKVPISIFESYEPALFYSTLAHDLIIQTNGFLGRLFHEKENHVRLDLFTLRGSHIQSLRGAFFSPPLCGVCKLKIADCQNLAIAPDFTTLTRLKSLTLDSCPELTELSLNHKGDVFPASLRELVIRHCHSLPIESALKTALLSQQKIKLLLENNSLCVSNSFVNTVLSRFLPDLENKYYFNVVTCNIEVKMSSRPSNTRTRMMYQLGSRASVIFSGENKQNNGRIGCINSDCTDDDVLVNLLRSKPSSRVKKLCIAGMHGLTVITEDLERSLLSLTSLKVLQIEECENLHSLPTDMSNLSSLTKIVIKSCNNFSPHNEGWNSVKDGECFLGLRNICHLELHRCQRLSSLPTDRRLSASSALQTLVIESCDGIRDLSSLDNRLPFLHRLRIAGCKNLDRPPRTGFTRFASLTTLELINCPKLTSLSLEKDCHLPSSLRDLTIISCGDLLTAEYLESYLRPLTSLNRLVIRNQVGRVPHSFVGWVLDLQDLEECDVFFKPPAFKLNWWLSRNYAVFKAALSWGYEPDETERPEETGPRVETDGHLKSTVFFKPPAFKINWTDSWTALKAAISWGYERDEIERREETRPRVVTDGWTREKLLIKMLERTARLSKWMPTAVELYIGGVHEITTTGGEFDELFGKLYELSDLTISHCKNLHSLSSSIRTHDTLKTVRIINCANDFSETAESFKYPVHYTCIPDYRITSMNKGGAELAPQFTSTDRARHFLCRIFAPEDYFHVFGNCTS